MSEDGANLEKRNLLITNQERHNNCNGVTGIHAMQEGGS